MGRIRGYVVSFLLLVASLFGLASGDTACITLGVVGIFFSVCLAIYFPEDYIR